ncbi:hypothetical protein BB560_002116 [Smittium megazygosporum]|uniref:Mo25-like protein n=1 Tax=Smittium megazygosporum TaxID=133381 RepID=A0A2T9ZFP3_9FUNG|nr:hypothetical protein BB560_002116 [Smittium megazygosporum]
MNFLFKTKTRTPSEIVKTLYEYSTKLNLTNVAIAKSVDEIAKCTSAILAILQDSNPDRKSGESNSELVVQLAQEIYTTDVLVVLIPNLYKIKFERVVGNREPTVGYLTKRPSILKDLIRGYNHQESAMFCGSMLRESIKHESLLDIVLDSSEFFLFFNYVEIDNFDISSDAFANFRDALLRFKPRVCRFLMDNYENFFRHYEKLIVSTNYVIRRQSLKLLGEILLERKNFAVMTKYISSADNLVLIMKALADKSKSIQYEAFHIFKIFVANPNKAQPVYLILKNNKEKLVTFLEHFQVEKDTDEQFRDEKAFLVKEIKKLV